MVNITRNIIGEWLMPKVHLSCFLTVDGWVFIDRNFEEKILLVINYGVFLSFFSSSVHHWR